MARSRRTPTLLFCARCSELFNHRSPSPQLRFVLEDYEDICTAITRKNNFKASTREGIQLSQIIPSGNTFHHWVTEELRATTVRPLQILLFGLRWLKSSEQHAQISIAGSFDSALPSVGARDHL